MKKFWPAAEEEGGTPLRSLDPPRYFILIQCDYHLKFVWYLLTAMSFSVLFCSLFTFVK